MHEGNFYPDRKPNTLISEEGVLYLASLEGIDTSKICVLAPRWAESAPKSEGAKSALVRCDLIVRSDGSAVFLDGAMGVDSMDLASEHMNGEANPGGLAWEEWTASVTELPKPLE